MDTKINFFKIGLFIITIVVFLLATVFWLGKYGFEKKKFDEYTIYFKESISGLNLGSSIKYKGFEVGNVNEIKINPAYRHYCTFTANNTVRISGNYYNIEFYVY